MPFNRQSIPGMGVLTTVVGTFTAATTLEVSVAGFRKVMIISVTPMAAPLADDVFGVNETVDADGLINVDADGEITIERPGSTGTPKVLVTFIGI